MKKYILAGAIALSATGVAQAQDFAGLYVGLVASDMSGNLDSISGTSARHEFSDYGDPLDNIDGGAFGVSLGMNWQNGSMVYGVEGNIGIGRAQVNFDDRTRRSSPRDVSLHGDTTNMYDVRGRLGVQTGDTLLYGVAGLASTEVEIRVRDSVNHGSGTESAFATNSHSGWVAGVGIEQKFRERISLRVEYNYYDLGDATYSFDAKTNNFGDEKVEFTTQVFRVGVNLALP